MGKGRKVQREWGKRSSLDQKKQRAFSNDGPRESGFEFSSKEKRRTESAVNPNGQFLAKSVLSRYATLLVIAAVLVGLIILYMRPTFQSEGNQSAISSVNTVPTESENKIKQLTEADSNLVDENRQIDFQIEDVLQMVKTMKEPNVLPQDVVEKYGKASSGSIDNSVKGSQLVELTYKLIGEKGDITLRFRDVEGRTELSLVYVRLFRNAWGPVTKSVDDYRTLIPQDRQEGVEVKQAIAELGMPKTIYASKSVKGQVDSISLSYSTTDNMTVSLYFDEVNGLYRLKSLLTSTV
ncbi:hypothetical protein [Streptococcus cristatus]|uniref:Uncharacterized protein n=1 Tax=Streptococcus cristatus TaxID=45634 RepID=A0A428HAJ4_STRCR|nr:hypothetical protein [Streptococcus cristatus]RSJ92762.1 hypothetical protein D8792_01640 [Streptococcus cristatus]